MSAPGIDALAAELHAICELTGHRFFKVYDDWLSLAVAAFARQPGITERAKDPNEIAYMEIIGRYGPRVPGKPHPADHFAEALGIFLLACQEHSAAEQRIPDLLGQLYERENLANPFSAQFFTPEPLVEMMVRLTIPETADPITIADPACGSGRFFIAAQRRAPKARFTGTDIDAICVRMATLNMLVRNAAAVIVHGDSLKLEAYGGYCIRPSVFGASLISLTRDEAQATLAAVVSATAPPAARPTAKPAGQPAAPTAPARPGGVVIDKKGQFGFDF